MKVTDRIADDMEELMAHTPGAAQLDWDVQIGVMPTQEGENICIGQFFFFGRNPVLAQGDLTVVEILPLEMAKNPKVLKALIVRSVELLAQQATMALAVQRDKPTSMLILP